jgi:hypothetical protein
MTKLLTVRDVAEILGMSEDSVSRRFQKVKGVIDLGSAESRNKRRYRVLRIPVSVVEGHLAKLGGATVTIQLPERAERRRKSPRWEDRAIRNLAKAGRQNGVTLDAKATYHILMCGESPRTTKPEVTVETLQLH